MASRRSIALSLVSIFINDISEIVKIPLILYADDIIIYFQKTESDLIVKTLNEALERTRQWTLFNSICVNANKTDFICFHKQGQNSKMEFSNKVSYHGLPLRRVFKLKYHGLIFDPTLTFSLHSDYVKTKLASIVGSIKKTVKFLPDSIFKIVLMHTLFQVMMWHLSNSVGLPGNAGSHQQTTNVRPLPFVFSQAKTWVPNPKEDEYTKSETVWTELVVCKYEPTDHPREGQMEQTEERAWVSSLWHPHNLQFLHRLRQNLVVNALICYSNLWKWNSEKVGQIQILTLEWTP